MTPSLTWPHNLPQTMNVPWEILCEKSLAACGKDNSIMRLACQTACWEKDCQWIHSNRQGRSKTLRPLETSPVCPYLPQPTSASPTPNPNHCLHFFSMSTLKNVRKKLYSRPLAKGGGGGHDRKNLYSRPLASHLYLLTSTLVWSRPLSLTKVFLPPLSIGLLCVVVDIPLVCGLHTCACVCVPLYVHVKMCR